MRDQLFEVKYFAADLIKSSGNQLFKMAKYQQSITEYERALSIFRFVYPRSRNWKNIGIFDDDLIYVNEEGANEKQKQIIRAFKLVLYLNLSAGYNRV